MSLSSIRLFDSNILYHAPIFLCLRIKYTSSSSWRRSLEDPYDTSEWDSSYSDNGWYYNNECVGLILSTEDYWNVQEEGKWAWPVVLASLFGIASICVGGLASIVLLGATCFRLKPYQLRRIAIAFWISSGLNLLTLIAGATNLCKKYDGQYNGCKRNGSGVRFGDGASLMLFGALFYFIAGFAVMSYRKEVLQTNEGGSEVTKCDEQEIAPLVASTPDRNQGITVITEESDMAAQHLSSSSAPSSPKKPSSSRQRKHSKKNVHHSQPHGAVVDDSTEEEEQNDEVHLQLEI